MKLPDPAVGGGPITDADHLTLCRRLLSTLSDAAPSVQTFRGRWSTVFTKLIRLRSDLSDLADLPAHPLSTDLLRSLADTLSLSLTLALHCRSPDPPAGKLHTQSELAAVSAALDHHLSDADLLLKSGLLLDPLPPPPAPSSTARPHTVQTTTSLSRREAVRADCRVLVTRLQIGSAESRSAALEDLIGLMNDDDKNVLIAVAQGAVPVLVRILESASSGQETRERAAAAIARVSSVASCRHVLAAEGLLLLNHLSRLLESGTGAAKEKACAALQSLTLTKENATAIGSRGGVASLLEICRAGTPTSQAAAAGVLRNLAAVNEIRQNLVDEGAVPVLARLAASGTAAAQENAVGCVRNLAAAEGRGTKALVVREFGIDALRGYWDSATAGGRGRDLEPAVGMVRNLAADWSITEALVSAGFLPRVAAALDSASSATRTEAARTVCDIAGGGKAGKEFGELGAVTRLVRMLEAKAAAEKDGAVRALAALVLVTENRRALKKDERGIGSLVQLLNPLVCDVDRRYPVAVLLSVSQSRKCRRRMVEAGAAGLLPRLVEMEVDGAKRLLDCLGKGKGMLWEALFART